MFLRFDATNGGGKFSEIADEVVLLDIIEQPAETDVQTVDFAGGHGMRVGNVRRKSLSVQLVYTINTQDPAKWAAAHDKVVQWAVKADSLTVSTRPGKKLTGKFYIPPAMGSVLRWTQELTITFTAYGVPFWQDTSSLVSKFISRGESTQFTCLCTADSVPVQASISNDGTEMLTEVILNVGHTKLHLQGLQLDPAPDSGDGMVQVDALQIGSLTGHDFTIKTLGTGSSGGESYLHTRTPDSSDVLLADTREPTPVYFWADQPATCWLTCTRWWV